MLGILRMITGLVALLASRMRPARRAHRETGSDTRAAEALAEMRAANMAEEAEHQRLFAECSLPAMDVELYSYSYIAPRDGCECDPRCTEDLCAPCRERELDELCAEVNASSRKSHGWAVRHRCSLCGKAEAVEDAAKNLCEECRVEDLCAPCYARSSTKPSLSRKPRVRHSAARECCDRCGENEPPAISVCLRCDKKLCEWCMMFEEDVCNACYEKSLGGVA